MQRRRIQTRSHAPTVVALSDAKVAHDAPRSTKRRATIIAAATAAGTATDGLDSNAASPTTNKKAETPSRGASKAPKRSKHLVETVTKRNRTLTTTTKRPKSTVFPIVALDDDNAINTTPAADTNNSNAKILYTYDHLVPGRLIRRYKRFLADVELIDPLVVPCDDDAGSDAVPVNTDNVVTVYCPNTGPMVGLLDLVHARVQLSKSNDTKRKYAYTLEMIQVDNGSRRVWVGVHSSLANRMVERALAASWLPELGRFATFQREVAFAASSRVDFVLSTSDDDDDASSLDTTVKNVDTSKQQCVQRKYVEVKSVSFAHPVATAAAAAVASLASSSSSLSGGSCSDRKAVALFPDTISIRAQKHVRELTELVEEAAQATTAATVTAAIVFLVQRDDCDAFAPSFVHDTAFAALCTDAAARGIQLLAYAVALEPHETEKRGHVRLLHALPLYAHVAGGADADEDDA